ncbi:GntR family transcriptional regulator, partial [Lactobacillus sp. XV13L]|nr:GntR family transcriptional regulator [Lactobacillus sp. XV13L]
MEYHDISSTNYVEEEIRTNPQILQQLQTERALAEHFDVSRTTIRNALNNLELEGFLVSDDTNLKLNNVFQVNMLTMTSFTEELKNDTNKLQIKMLTNQVIKTPIKLKDFFGSQQKQLIKIVRQRFLQQEPLSYETTYLPYDKFSGLAKFNLNGYSLYQLLSEQYQVRPSYG